MRMRDALPHLVWLSGTEGGRVRTRPCLYAATFAGLPGVVKIGRTSQGWAKRGLAYRGVHGGVLSCAIYSLYEEADLVGLEQDLILSIGLPLHSGVEWFSGGLLTAALAIEKVLDAYDLSYAVEVRNAV